MKTPKVNTCCCGCTLYRGTMIIAILTTISCVLSVINILAGAQGSKNAFDMAVGIMRANNNSTHANDTEIDDLAVFLKPVFHLIDGVTVANCIFILAISVTLIYGTCKRSPAYILPWLMTEVVVCVFAIIAYIGASIFVIVQLSVVGGLVMLLVILLALALQCYFIIVVYSFYLEVKSPSDYEASRQVNYKV